MKKHIIILITSLLLLVGCSSKFSAVQGELPADQIVNLVGASDETAAVSFTSINTMKANGAAEAIAPAGPVTIQAAYIRGADKFSKELSFEAKGAETYKVDFRSEDVEYKMGSKDTKHKVALFVSNLAGEVVAGSDTKDAMEFAVQ